MNNYEKDIKEAAKASSNFDKVNAKEIANYFNEDIERVLKDIKNERELS